ncbi:MAG: erythromycin esterase family protein [Bdellovibrionota bacterium]
MSLIREKGFQLVALEADWPDVEIVNAVIHGKRESWETFRRFPEWMWRNTSFVELVNELRAHNSSEGRAPASIFGIDLYSLSSSLRAVSSFLRHRMPESAEKAMAAEACLEPWRSDPSQYGLAVWRGLIRGCEAEVLELLKTLHENRLSSSAVLSGELLSAFQNARVLRNAEEYYRSMYEGRVESWNLRDSHMFETLLVLLDHYGPDSKIVVWEHNSHLGNAAATQMGKIGEHNVGQLCKTKFGNDCYSIGFMSDHGTVAAATEWEAPVEIKALRPARPDSFEFLLHQTGVKNFFLPLKTADSQLRNELRKERLERAVGVIYLPRTERSSHYFNAKLADQFDEVCWLDETSAVEPLPMIPETGPADTYPFGL